MRAFVSAEAFLPATLIALGALLGAEPALAEEPPQAPPAQAPPPEQIQSLPPPQVSTEPPPESRPPQDARTSGILDALPPGVGPDQPSDPPLDPSKFKAADLKQARAVAKEADLTPIIPSPKDPLKPAFQLYSELDLPVLGVGIVLLGSRFVRRAPAYCAPLCDPDELNALDHLVAGRWDPGWAAASDIGLFALGAGTVLFLAFDEGPLPALNDLVVIAQSALIATTLPSLATFPIGRPRPYLYGTKAPLEQRQSGDASLSFISSHTSTSFAFATSAYMALRRLHPKTSWPWTALGVGLTGASFVAVSRVFAGSHFPTDVITGAITGASVGVLIPSLHGSPVRVVPQVTQSYKGAVFFRDF